MGGMNTESLTTLHCGMGRDSIAMLCLLADGALIVDGEALDPGDLDAVIFADPGEEWGHTYGMVPRVQALCELIGVRFLELKKPPAEVWGAQVRAKGSRETPAWCAPGGTIEERAERGAYHRRLPIMDEYMRLASFAATVSGSCTSNQKIDPIRRCTNDLAVERFGIDHRRWSLQAQKGLRPRHRSLIGIAADEASRAIDPGRPFYERPVYPLIPMGVSKADEREILERWGFQDTLKSGCIMCPYQGAGWFWALRTSEPRRWAKVLDYEATALARNPKLGGIVAGVPVAVAVERWRERNPDATVEAVLSKSYSRCRPPPKSASNPTGS